MPEWVRTAGELIGVLIGLFAISAYNRAHWNHQWKEKFNSVIEQIDLLKEQVSLKMSIEMCVQRHGEVKNRLDKGDAMFAGLIDRIDKMNDLLIRLDTTINLYITSFLPEIKEIHRKDHDS